MFIIVKDDTLPYRYVRLDMWKTPVYHNSITGVERFSNAQEAEAFVKRFNLVSTHHPMYILSTTTNEAIMCTFENDGKGKFVMKSKRVKNASRS